MIAKIWRDHAFVCLVALGWLALAIVELSLNLKQATAATDPLSQLFTIPSAWLKPVREGLLHASSALPGYGGELLPGLSVGDTSRVSENLESAMKTASLTHLVAVSGANCHIVTATAFAVLSWVGAPRLLRIGGAVTVLVAFVALVTPGASISRAAVMSLAVLVGMTSGRLVAGLPVLAVTVVVLLVINPLWATNFGFVLSVLATAGLLTLTTPISKFLERWLPTWLSLVIAVPLSASVLCQPVIILLAPQLPTYGVVANLLAVPAAGVVTILGLLVALSSLIWMPAATLIAWVAWLPAQWIGTVAQALAGAPFAKIAWPPGWLGLLLALTVSLLFVVTIISQRKRLRVQALVAWSVVLGSAVLWTLSSSVNRVIGVPAKWRIAACDVGQGDAFLFREYSEKDHRWHTALVDTGRYPELLRDCLVRVGITRLDLLVLTHYDVDHVGGASVVAGMADHVIVGTPENADDQRLKDRVCEHAQTCELATAGMVGAVGEAQWQILWPNGRTRGMQLGNPGSVTLLVEWPDLSALFTGDLGEAAQEAMLAENQDIPVVDVLKVAHHGSSDTSQKLIYRIQPQVGLISVGSDNGYGHPTSKAISMLRNEGASIGRTDEQGMLFITGNAESLTLSSDR